MGREFEFGCTAGLLLGRAEAAGGGGQFAARWRRGALEEFWKNSEDSRKKNKYLVFVGFREFLLSKVSSFTANGVQEPLEPPRLLTGSIRKQESAWHFRSVTTNIEQILCSFQSHSKYDVHSSWIYLEGAMLSYGMY